MKTIGRRSAHHHIAERAPRDAAVTDQRADRSVLGVRPALHLPEHRFGGATVFMRASVAHMSDALQPSPHDALFRHAFGQTQNAVGLLQALVPAQLVAAVDWASLRLHEGTSVDPRLRELESDLVFSARAGGREVLFYFLVEHQSSSDPLMVWRLWKYVTRVWEGWMRDQPNATRLPRVIPIVVYHGARRWSAARSIAELIDDEPAVGEELEPLLPRFTYILDDLTVLGPEELRARALPAFASLVLWALRNAAERSFAQTVHGYRCWHAAFQAAFSGSAPASEC